MVAVIIISVDNFPPFRPCFVSAPFVKLEMNLKSFISNHALTTKISDILIIQN